MLTALPVRGASPALLGVDDEKVARAVVRDLVRNAAEDEAPSAGHAAVTDDDQISLDVLGARAQRFWGGARPAVRPDRAAGLGRLAPCAADDALVVARDVVVDGLVVAPRAGNRR